MIVALTQTVCCFVLGGKSGPTDAAGVTERLTAELISTAVQVQTGVRRCSCRQTHRNEVHCQMKDEGHCILLRCNLYWTEKSPNVHLILKQWKCL